MEGKVVFFPHLVPFFFWGVGQTFAFFFKRGRAEDRCEWLEETKKKGKEQMEQVQNVYQINCISDKDGIIRVSRPFRGMTSQHVLSIGLDSVSVPLTMENVMYDQNDCVYFSEGPNQGPVTFFRARLPHGAFNIDMICANMTAAMNGAMSYYPIGTRPMNSYAVVYNGEGRVTVKATVMTVPFNLHLPHTDGRCVGMAFGWTMVTMTMKVWMQDFGHGLAVGDVVNSMSGIVGLSGGAIGQITSVDDNARTVDISAYRMLWPHDIGRTSIAYNENVSNVDVVSMHANAWTRLVNFSMSTVRRSTMVTSAYGVDSSLNQLIILQDQLPLSGTDNDTLRVTVNGIVYELPVVYSGADVRNSTVIPPIPVQYWKLLESTPNAVLVTLPSSLAEIMCEDVDALPTVDVVNAYWCTSKVDVMNPLRGVLLHCNVNTIGDIGNVIVPDAPATKYMASLPLKNAGINDIVYYGSNELVRYDHAISHLNVMHNMIDFNLTLYTWAQNSTPIKFERVVWDCIIRVTTTSRPVHPYQQLTNNKSIGMDNDVDMANPHRVRNFC